MNTKNNKNNFDLQIKLQKSFIDTPLGTMIAIADMKSLYFLDFADKKNIDQRIERLLRKANGIINLGTSNPIISIETELKAYFSKTLQQFQTPLILLGTPFEQLAWAALQNIQYGTKKSYLEQAILIKRPLACRAVAQANAANPIVIVVPCHRVINSNGELGGYNGGTERKKWLLSHEGTNESSVII